MAIVERTNKRERRSDHDGGESLWNFGQDTVGMVKRLEQAKPGDVLFFRQGDQFRPVSPSRGARWAQIFEELCDRGILNTALFPGKIAFEKTSIPFTARDVLGTWTEIAQSDEHRKSQVNIANFSEKKSDIYWPEGLDVDFFIRDEVEKGIPEQSLMQARLATVLTYIRDKEARENSLDPALNFNYRVEGVTPRSFGACLVRCFRSIEGVSSEDIKQKVVLVAGDYIVERPFLAYQNNDRRVFRFKEEKLEKVTSFSEFALLKFPYDTARLYRTMGFREAEYWDKGDVAAFEKFAAQLLDSSLDGIVSWGHLAPTFHFSIQKEAWPTLPHDTVVRRFDIPKRVLCEWQKDHNITVGIGIGIEGGKSGSLLEIGIPMKQSGDLIPFLKENL